MREVEATEHPQGEALRHCRMEDLARKMTCNPCNSEKSGSKARKLG